MAVIVFANRRSTKYHRHCTGNLNNNATKPNPRARLQAVLPGTGYNKGNQSTEWESERIIAHDSMKGG